MTRIRFWWLPFVFVMAVHAQQIPPDAPEPAAAAEAVAERRRAMSLIKLNRTGEALEAWRSVEAAWKRLDDGPGQIEAVGWQAVIELRTNAPAAATLLQRAVAIANAETKRPRAAVTRLVEVAGALSNRSMFDAARDTCTAAIAFCERILPDSPELAAALNQLGTMFRMRGDLASAAAHYQRALAINEKIAPDSLGVAGSFNNLGTLAWLQGRLSDAADLYRRALAIQEQRAPGTLPMAVVLNNLALVVNAQGNLAEARALHERALGIREKAAPESLDVAMSLSNLGTLARAEGNLEAARDYQQRALTIYERLAPGSLSVAGSMNNLGVVLAAQGDLAAARDLYVRALEIRAALAPKSLDLALSLMSVGNVAIHMGDISTARDSFERALALQQAAAPDSLAVAGSLNNLGIVASEQGDFLAARQFHERALAIRVKLAPDSLDEALSAFNLGDLSRRTGDLDVASDYFQRALKIRQRAAPDSEDVAETFYSLGTVAEERNSLDVAREYYERALAIGLKIAPNSVTTAGTQTSLGRVLMQQGDLGGARRLLQQALSITEAAAAPTAYAMAPPLVYASIAAEREGDRKAAADFSARAWKIIRARAGSIAGDEASQSFASYLQPITAELIRLQIALGKPENAFAMLEEARAQALLQLISERGVARSLAPADIWRRYELAQAAANRAARKLEGEGVPQPEREQAREQYTMARLEAEARWADVRRSIETAVPAPLSADEARRSLPADSVLAAFVVGDDESTLFIVRRDRPVQAFQIPVGSGDLSTRVSALRETVSHDGGGRALRPEGSAAGRTAPELAHVDRARDLFQTLFPADARKALRGARRILLSPDGVLWDLPFAALVTNDGGSTPQYLGVEKPLVYVQSLTTFARTLQADGRAPVQGALVIGNPLYDSALRNTPAPAAQGDVVPSPGRGRGELALLSRDGEIPAPLPYAEVEAREVAALYGSAASGGAEPTESWFRARAADARIIHLATHGYYNPFRAVSSGVRLAVPEREPAGGETDNDGALQAWEVMQLQLNAELVVLSACETGVGSKVSGEGLVGLTRAFQIAGARSIVATQWRVADRSTASAMVAFHRNLAKGLPKDEALTRAMQTLAKDSRTAHPSYWAPFMLIGDFRPLQPARR